MLLTDDEVTRGDEVGSSGRRSNYSFRSLRYSALRCLAGHPKWVQAAIWGIVLGSTVIGIALWSGGFLHITDVGYLATFYLNLVGAATIILPVPGVLAACVAAEPSLGLNPILIGIVGAAGATLGETTAYLVGFAGHDAAMKLRWYRRIRGMMERHGSVTLFIVSVIPTPFFDLAGIAAGALNYSFGKFLIYVFAGKTIRLIIMAYACRQGIEWLRTIYQFNLPLG